MISLVVFFFLSANPMKNQKQQVLCVSHRNQTLWCIHLLLCATGLHCCSQTKNHITAAIFTPNYTICTQLITFIIALFLLGVPGLRYAGCESWHTKQNGTIINFITYTCVYDATECKTAYGSQYWAGWHVPSLPWTHTVLCFDSIPTHRLAAAQ